MKVHRNIILGAFCAVLFLISLHVVIGNQGDLVCCTVTTDVNCHGTQCAYETTADSCVYGARTPNTCFNGQWNVACAHIDTMFHYEHLIGSYIYCAAGCEAPTPNHCGTPPVCVDFQTDNRYCGDCSHSCTTGYRCLAGTCTYIGGNGGSCGLDDTTLDPVDCTGGHCYAGNKLTVSLERFQDCSATRFIETSASNDDGSCLINFTNGNMLGMYYPNGTPPTPANINDFENTGYRQFSYNYTIPPIPTACNGASLTHITTSLYRGLPSQANLIASISNVITPIFLGNPNHCGDGIVNVAGEQCDDGNFNNNDDCRNDCKWNVCGDGFPSTLNHNLTNEQCDNGTLNGHSCNPVYGTSCNYCSNQCTVATENNFCGDTNITNLFEDCDFSAGVPLLNNYTCQSLNFTAGSLGCYPINSPGQCHFNTSLCTLCGNGIPEAGEQCDNGVYNTNSCSPPYGADCAFCNTTCHNQFVLATRYCGDHNVTDQEQCDFFANGFPNTQGYNCTTINQGFIGGQLGCYSPGFHAQCRFDNSSCISYPPCQILSANLTTRDCGANCSAGNNLTATITYIGACYAANFVQMDAKSKFGRCTIQYSGVDMPGIFYPPQQGGNGNGAGGAFVDTIVMRNFSWNYKIPTIQNPPCGNERLINITVGLAYGPPTDLNVSNYYYGMITPIWLVGPFCGNHIRDPGEECDGDPGCVACHWQDIKITSATVGNTCPGGVCKMGDNLTISFKYNAGQACNIANLIAQTNFGNGCLIDWDGILGMQGMNTNFTCVQNPFKYTYLIPHVTGQCAGALLNISNTTIYSDSPWSIMRSNSYMTNQSGVIFNQCPEYGTNISYVALGGEPTNFTAINNTGLPYSYTCTAYAAKPAIVFEENITNINNNNGMGNNIIQTVPTGNGVLLFNPAIGNYSYYACGVSDGICPNDFQTPGLINPAVCTRHQNTTNTDADCLPQTYMKCGVTRISGGIFIDTCLPPSPTPHKNCKYTTSCVYANEAGTPNQGGNISCFNTSLVIPNKDGHMIQCVNENTWCPEFYVFDTITGYCKIPSDTCGSAARCPYAKIIAEQHNWSDYVSACCNRYGNHGPPQLTLWGEFLTNFIEYRDATGNNSCFSVDNTTWKNYQYCGAYTSFPENRYNYLNVSIVYPGPRHIVCTVGSNCE